MSNSLQKHLQEHKILGIEPATEGNAGSTTLSGLSDVELTSTISGQNLVFDGSNWTNQTPPAGVTDHGLLTGLSDDDHSQYHTDSRALTWLNTKSINELSDVITTATVSGEVLTFNGTNWVNQTPAYRNFGLTLDGGGSVITTGHIYAARIPYNGTIVKWELVADQPGNIVIDLWKDTYANFPPTIADTITGTEKPTLAGTIKNYDDNLATWNTTITEGDWIFFKVDSASTLTFVTLTIIVEIQN